MLNTDSFVLTSSLTSGGPDDADKAMDNFLETFVERSPLIGNSADFPWIQVPRLLVFSFKAQIQLSFFRLKVDMLEERHVSALTLHYVGSDVSHTRLSTFLHSEGEWPAAYAPGMDLTGELTSMFQATGASASPNGGGGNADSHRFIVWNKIGFRKGRYLTIQRTEAGLSLLLAEIDIEFTEPGL